MDRKNSSTVTSLKTQAKLLREYLAEQGIELAHNKCLHAVARSHGYKNWNTARATVLPQSANFNMSTFPGWEDTLANDPSAEWADLMLPGKVAAPCEVAGVYRREDGEWVPRNYEAALLLQISTETTYPDGTVWHEEAAQDEPFFTVSNGHVASSGMPPVINGNSDGYHSYFENHHGEQAVFRWDYRVPKGTLWMGDCGWEQPIQIDAEGNMSRPLVLNAEEKMWLAACMKAVNVG